MMSCAGIACALYNVEAQPVTRERGSCRRITLTCSRSAFDPLQSAEQRVPRQVALRSARVPCGATRSKLSRSRQRSEEHTSELQSRPHLVCRLLLEKKNHK